MTPISFALEILLDCTTIEQAHKRARKYIKQVESQEPGKFIPRSAPTLTQAPSTQRILDEMAATGMASMPPVPVVPARIQGGMIDNGDGTKSKRKW